ncbi:MAG TPA: hypothetical protein VGU02_12255 [Gaiellaceae bacterium]|nr:hypothetical protein [Gaiellaceae bacterium]
MKNIPEGTYLDPVVGWRFWRVQRIQTLANAATRYRLCAAGKNGRPKVWQPKTATVAHCSDWSARHEAPHPNHSCGIYAYSDLVDAERHLAVMEAFAQNADKQTPTSDAWALGRVSLWGRVVECEKGWRAQFAYPYTLTIFTGRSGLVSQITDDYAVDAERLPRADVAKLVKKYPDAVDDALSDAAYDKWYSTTIYGRMDSSFLKPYHEAVMARFDALEASVAAIKQGRNA